MFVQTNQPALAECLSMVTFYMKHEKTNMNILTVVERGSNWGVAAIQRARTDRDLVLAQGGDAADPCQDSRGALRAHPTAQSDHADQRNSEGSCPAVLRIETMTKKNTKTKTMTKTNTLREHPQRALPETCEL